MLLMYTMTSLKSAYSITQLLWGVSQPNATKDNYYHTSNMILFSFILFCNQHLSLTSEKEQNSGQVDSSQVIKNVIILAFKNRNLYTGQLIHWKIGEI